MISLSILIAIWGLISLYKIYKHKSKRGTPMDFYDDDDKLTYYYLGVVVFIALIINLITLFLP